MKIAKRIALVLFLLVFLVVTSGILIAYVYQDRVKSFLVEEISKNLEAETGVAKIEFSVLQKFPMASLSFEQIWCKAVGEQMTYDTLFFAEKLFLQFHIMDIFSDNYSITKIDLENARVNLEFNKYGAGNYKFWRQKDTKDQGDGSQTFTIKLDKMVFDNTHFNYVDAKRRQNFAFHANHMEAAGSLMESTGSLSLTYNILGEKLLVDKTNYVENKTLIGSIDMMVDSVAYEIKSGVIGVDGLKVKVDGYLDKEVSGSSKRELSLRFRGSSLDISTILALLPNKDLMKPYSVEGSSDLIVSVRGDLNTKKAPVVRIDFKTQEASLKIDSLNLVFTHIELDGMYSSNYDQDIGKRQNKGYVEVYSFSSQIGFDHFKGSFKLWDFGNTKLDLKITGEVDLENLKDSNVPTLDSMLVIEGQVQFEISTKGLLKAYTDHKRNYIKNVGIQGFIDVENLLLQHNQYALPIDVDEGRFVISDNDLLVENLSIEIESSNLILDGYFQNAIPFLLMEEQNLFVEAKLRSELIDLNELLLDYSSSSTSDTVYELEFPNHLNFNLTTDIEQLVFRRFDARDIGGRIKLKDQKLVASNLKFKSMGGAISLSGLLDGSGEKLLVSCDAKVEDIDISKVFYTCENFGQDYITEHNIKGIGTVDVQFVSVWNKDLTIIEDKIYTKADLTIVKGELINNKSLLALSDYIAVSELEHVRFSTLKNQIVIKNRNIHIPKMEISSSALDITVSGDHTFDHEINYKFKIYLPELLSKKSKRAKKANDEFGVIEDDGLGMWLFLSMTGTVKNPIIKYDKKSYVQKIGEDFKKEKQTLKAILNEEFGWFKKDTSIVNKNKKKKDTKENFGDDYFIIEWDEDAEGLGSTEDDDDDF